MFLVLLFGLMIAFPNYYTSHYGTLELFGITFTMGAVLFIPLLTVRDILHESGKIRYLVAAVVLGVVATYLTVTPAFAAAAAAALIWCFLIDTNIYLFVRHRWGVWPAYILSDCITIPTIPLLFYAALDKPVPTPGEELIVKYAVMFLVYLTLFLLRNHRQRFQSVLLR